MFCLIPAIIAKAVMTASGQSYTSYVNGNAIR